MNIAHYPIAGWLTLKIYDLQEHQNYMKKSEIFWLDVNRFDTCQFKIRSIKMMDSLIKQGLPITYVTSYVEQTSSYPGFHYLKTQHKYRGIFRLSFYWAFLCYIRSYLKPGNKILLITFPDTIYIAITVKLWGWLQRCHVDIHVDFRTVPVFAHNNQVFSIFKYLIEIPLFWKLPIFINRFFVSTNSFITNQMRRRTGIKKPHCIWTSGVSDELTKLQSSLKVDLPPRPFELLYLGSMGRHRGVKEIIQALASAPDQLDNFIFRIIGGDGLEPMQQLVKQKKLEKIIQFDGVIAYDQVPKYLAKANAFISPLPDHPWWEVSSPLKLFEYLATGKPIILTDITPHRDVVPNATPGIIWLADLTPTSILTGIIKMIEQYEKYTVGHRDRIAIASNYTWFNQGKKLGRFIQKEYPVFVVDTL